MKSISYIACPYTHPDLSVREYRARLSAWVAGNLVAKGEVVYCPITHGHMMACECDLPTDWEFWMGNDSVFFALCDKLYVIKADGWEQSCGVQVEIAMAANVNMPVEYIDPGAFGPWHGAAKTDKAERQRDAMIVAAHAVIDEQYEMHVVTGPEASYAKSKNNSATARAVEQAAKAILAAGEAVKEKK